MRKNFINIWGNYIARMIPGELFYPQPTGKITNNLYTICDGNESNFFIYTDGKDTICIDVGYRNNNHVKDDFNKIGINPDKISHVFLTHTDMDHAGALDSDSKSNWLGDIEIFMGKGEEKLITKKQRRRFMFYTPIQISKKYNLLNDSDVIKVGNIKVKAIHTPGHTPGHMSYLINDKILFVGDLLLFKNGEAEQFYYVWNKSHQVNKESIKKIAQLDGVEIICTAHSKCSFEFDKVLKKWK